MTTPKINEYISYIKKVAEPSDRFPNPFIHNQFILRMNEVIKVAEGAEELKAENEKLHELLDEIRRCTNPEQRGKK